MYNESIKISEYYSLIDELKKKWIESKRENRKIDLEYWDSQVPESEKRKMKFEFLLSEKNKEQRKVDGWLDALRNSCNRKDPTWWRDLVGEYYNKACRDLEKIKARLYFFQKQDFKNKEKITDEMIIRAREYPLEDLIEVNSAGFAICPFHPDHKPSLYIKNGFFYCFVCGKSGNAIDLVMARDNLTFVEAVKRLSCG